MAKSSQVYCSLPISGGFYCDCTHVNDVSAKQFVCHCPIFVQERCAQGSNRYIFAKYIYKHRDCHTIDLYAGDDGHGPYYEEFVAAVKNAVAKCKYSLINQKQNNGK